MLNRWLQKSGAAAPRKGVDRVQVGLETVARPGVGAMPIVESIADAFVSVDAQWRFTYVNMRAEDIYGMERGTLLGRDFWEVFPAAVGTVFEDHYRRAMTTRESVVFEAFYQPLNESWFEINVYPTQDGGIAFYFRDITHRKRMEAINAGQNNAMEMALAGEKLEPILAVLTQAVETQSGNGAKASILLLSDDGLHLRHGAGPSLPQAYNEAIDGI
ncbi:MAG: PAS domain-containing protein, partial [Alphaproteobacteria bacterium]|nr:PAS domain-containing protein [Alphaproteobacteria bacterium]